MPPPPPFSPPPPLFDLTGVIHCHSTYSDGTGTVPQIAAAARANGLDFLVLTDHDTLAARDNGEEGWHGSVLVLVGEEVSPRGENHYLALGLERPIDHRGLSSAEVVAQVGEQGGFGFLAHPFSRGSERFRRGGAGMPWRDLEAPGYTGIELWSFVTDTAERINGVRDLLSFVIDPGRFVDHPPRRNLQEWDRLGAGRRCVALGGVDAHQIGFRVGNRVPLRLMAYARSFRHLRTHVLSERPLSGLLGEDRETIHAALQAGRAYLAVDSLAPARGFSFWAEGDDGLLMGDEAAARPLRLRARLPRAARVRILRDGSEIASSPHAPEIACEVSDPGVYRVDARLRARGRERTWILSNPIYLRPPPAPGDG